MVYRTNIEGHFTFVNVSTASITGYDEKELLGKHYSALIILVSVTQPSSSSVISLRRTFKIHIRNIPLLRKMAVMFGWGKILS